MKSKKLISLLCAAAMTVSAFAGLTTTASAAATPVWSFDGSSEDGWTGTVAAAVKTDEGSTDSYLDFLAGTGTKCNDVTFELPAAAQLSDDYVLEYDTFIHTGNGMGRLAQYTQLAFTGANPEKDTQNYGGDYADEAAPAMEGRNCDCHSTWNNSEETGWGYVGDIVSTITNRIELDGNMVINNDGTQAPSINDGDAQIGDSKWVRVRVEVKDGKAKTTIADSNGTILDGVEFAASATKLTQIKMTFGRADTTHFIPTNPANIKLDNVKVYSGIAGTPAFSTADLRKSAVVATPVPLPEKVAGPAPKVYAPDSAENPYVADFNAATADEIAHVTVEEQPDPFPVVNGMTVKLGNRSDGADLKTFAKISKIADGDNALKLAADKFSTNGRGPVVSLTDDIDLSDMTSGSAVMSFAVYLSRTEVDGIERLFLFDNTDNVDGNGCARDVVAVITTEDIKTEDDAYKYTAGDSNIGIHVEPEQWHTITVVATAGDSPVRLFVDGNYKDEQGKLSPALKLDMVGTGEGNKHAVTHLPKLAIENTKASTQNAETGLYEGGTVYSAALIDNVLTYFVQGELEPKNLPQTSGKEPTPAPTATATPQPKHNVTVAYADGTATVSTDEDAEFDAVVIAANYNAANHLEKIAKIQAVKVKKDAPATVTGLELAEGDKVMVWNSVKDMIPYGAHTVTEAEANATKPTAPPTQAPTATPTAAPTPTPTTVAGDPTPTPVTGGDPTPTPTTVTGDPTPSPTTAADDPTPAPTATTEPTVPDLTGKTVMIQNDFSTDSVWGFSTGRTAPAVANGMLVLTKGNNSGKNTMEKDTKVFNDAILTSTDTEIMFDYNPQVDVGNNRWSSLSITDASDDEKVIFSLTAIGTTGKNGIGYAIGQRAVCANSEIAAPAVKVIDLAKTADDKATNKNTIRVYLHVAGGKVSGLVFDITDGTPKFLTEIPETAIDAANVGKMVAQEGYSLAPQAIDNVILVTNDANWKAPLAVTVTAPDAADGTLAADKTEVIAGNVITITPKAATGKKLTAVKVNATEVTPTEETTGEGDDAVTKTVYKYTVAGTETAIAVTAEFARADATAVEISGDASVAIANGTANYTAVVKAGTVTVDGTVTWSVAAKDGAAALDAGTTISDAGVLTIASTQAATTVVITASTKKDVANAEDTEVVTATKEVTLVAEPVYNLAKAAMTNGDVSFTVGTDEAATQVKQSETLEIVPVPAAGYSASKVEYIKTSDLTAYNTAKDEYDALEDKTGATEPAAPTWTEVTKANDKYTVAGSALSGDITVKVTYTAIPYSITNANATADANGNSIAIDKTTATVGQDVVITVTAAQGYKLSALTYTTDAEGATPVTIANNTFKMPAANVTVNATFEEWDGIYYSEDFSSFADTDAITTWYNGGTAGGQGDSKFIVDGENHYISIINNNAKAIRHVMHKVDAISIADGVKIAYDYKISNIGTDACGAEVVFGSSDATVVFALGNYETNKLLKCYAGGEISTNHGKAMACDAGKGWGTNEKAYDAANFTAVGTADIDTTKWYHAEITISEGKASVTVSEKGNADSAVTVNDVAVAASNITLIKLSTGKVMGVNGSSKPTLDVDNIMIKTLWSTAE